MDGVLIAGYLQLAPPAPSVLAGFSETTGHWLWARTVLPDAPSLQAEDGVVLMSGFDDLQGRQVPTPLTALFAANGKTLWHAAVGFLYDLWTVPGHALFSSATGMYDVNPATGAKRWKAPVTPQHTLLTSTEALYFVNSGDLTDRRLSDGTVAWRQPGAPGGGGGTFIVAPSGPNALIAGGNNFDEAPQTVVSTVNLGTGKLVATVKLPSDLPAAPVVTGSDAIYELNPEYCVHAGSAGQGPISS